MDTISREIQSLGGRIIQECVISDIFYHGMLVELPRIAIEELVNNYEEIELSKVDDIMFFRPVCQSAFISENDSKVCTLTKESPLPVGDAVVAVFDGMPMQNHRLLRNRVIIDDPDDYATDYESKYRIHGTSMVSLAIYGDLNRMIRLLAVLYMCVRFYARSLALREWKKASLMIICSLILFTEQ